MAVLCLCYVASAAIAQQITVPAHRLLQWDIDNNPFGSKKSSFSLLGQPLKTEGNFGRRVAIVRFADLAQRELQETLEESLFGGVAIILPKKLEHVRYRTCLCRSTFFGDYCKKNWSKSTSTGLRGGIGAVDSDWAMVMVRYLSEYAMMLLSLLFNLALQCAGSNFTHVAVSQTLCTFAQTSRVGQEHLMHQFILFLKVKTLKPF